ncbi:MAG: hypothetical protein RSE46_23195, partial [Janthinobacterium sp.]
MPPQFAGHYIRMKKTTTRRKPKPPAAYFSYELRQPAIDLFGEVAVIEDDLYDWVASVAPLDLSPRAFANYVRGYDVAAKVRHAKLHGMFDVRRHQGAPCTPMACAPGLARHPVTGLRR